MKKIAKIFILLVFIGAFSSTAKSDPSIRYALCRENIAKIEVVPQGDLYSLHITLTESAREDFFSLTKENIGKTLDIVFKDVFISGADIEAPIKSGCIISVPATKEEAHTSKQRILDSRDDAFCGKVN